MTAVTTCFVVTHSKQSINLLRTAFRTYEVDSSVNTCHVLHLGPNRHFQVEMHVIDLDPKDEVGRLKKWRGDPVISRWLRLQQR